MDANPPLLSLLFYVGSFISVPFMVIYFTIIFFPFEM
jgi:hypothetical protein